MFRRFKCHQQRSQTFRHSHPKISKHQIRKSAAKCCPRLVTSDYIRGLVQLVRSGQNYDSSNGYLRKYATSRADWALKSATAARSCVKYAIEMHKIQ